MYSILYVDDEEVLLAVNKIYLEKSGDFSVDTSSSAPEALAKMRTRSYDAIVSDYDMPVMDGIAFLKEVRLNHGSMPFLIFTGKGREEVVIEAVDSGADFYIQKGQDMKGMIAELRHKILRAIERRRMFNDLEHSRRQMTDIINFLPDATFVRDIEGRVIAWNRAMEGMTGIRSEDILGRGDYEYSLPFYHEKCPIAADLVLGDGPPPDNRYRYFVREGEKIISEVFIPHFNGGCGANLWIAAGPLYDTTGAVSGAIASFRDITASYEVRQALDRSREMNAGLAEMVPVGVFQSDLDGNLTFSNRLCREIFGLAERDLDGGICIIDYIAPEDQERAKVDIRNAAGGKHGRGQEYLLKREDGSIFPALVIGGPVTDPATCNPAGIRGVIVDLTGRKWEAQKLYESRERLALALSAGESGIWDADMQNGTIHDIHQWACQALGYDESDLAHITINSAIKMTHPVDLPTIRQAYSRHLAGETPLFSSEFRLVAKDGQWKYVAIRGKIIERDPDNKPIRITGIINTICAKKADPGENAPLHSGHGSLPNAA